MLKLFAIVKMLVCACDWHHFDYSNQTGIIDDGCRRQIFGQINAHNTHDSKLPMKMEFKLKGN